MVVVVTFIIVVNIATSVIGIAAMINSVISIFLLRFFCDSEYLLL